MKTKITLTFIGLFLSFAVVSAQNKKEIKIKSHAAIVDALTDVKSSCESVRALSTDWPDSVKNKMGLLYTNAKRSSDKLIADYEVIIPDWRYAQRHNLDVKPQLEALEQDNNAMVNYFTVSYLKYGSKKAGLSITTEIIDMVFDVVTKTYDFFRGISDAQIALYKKEVDDQRISYQFNGVQDSSPAASSMPSTKVDATPKTDKGTSAEKKGTPPKTNN